MRHSETRFQALVEETDVIIIVITDGVISYANPILETITGYTKEDFLVHSNLCQHQLLQSEKHQHVTDGDLNTPSPQQETKFLTKKGEECYLSYSIKTIKFDGKPAKLVTAVNITKRKQAEKKIQKILKREKKIGEDRVQFASMIAHELRRPLTAISFSSNLLKRYSSCWSQEKIEDYFHRLQKAVEILNLLIDKVLIFSRVDIGKLKFEPQALNIMKFCHDFLDELYPGGSYQNYIKFSFQGDYPLVCVDKIMLRVILTNLLENAIKYSPTGEIVDFVLSCQSEQVIFQIKDRGIGIESKDVERLFEPFYRGNNIGESPGTGLGLCIVKKLVDIHNGQIKVESQFGVGTEFTITLPSTMKYQQYQLKIENLSCAEQASSK